MKVHPRFKDLLKESRAAGWEVRLTRGDHLRWTHPQASSPVFSAATPSDHRAVKNTRAMLRRVMKGSDHG